MIERRVCSLQFVSPEGFGPGIPKSHNVSKTWLLPESREFDTCLGRQLDAAANFVRLVYGQSQ